MARVRCLMALSLAVVEVGASVSAADSICKIASDYNADATIGSMDSARCGEVVQYFFPSGLAASTEECARVIQDTNARDPFSVAQVLMDVAVECCGGAGKDACAEFGKAHTICKTRSDFQPDATDADWGGATCTQMSQFLHPDGFVASQESCAEETDASTGIKRTVSATLAMASPTCCGGSGKDACVDFAPAPLPICKDMSDFVPDAKEASWRGADCRLMASKYMFPKGFTASKESCTEQRTDDHSGNTYTIATVLNGFGATCCGGLGKDACADIVELPQLCKSRSDFDKTKTVRHNNEDVTCAQVAESLGLAVATREKCAETVKAGGISNVRSTWTEKYKATCCGGADSICTKHSSSKDALRGATGAASTNKISSDELSGALHLANLAIPAAVAILITV